MKRYILPPLCSAFIVPGLGQILNKNIKKGLIILSSVFILLIAATIQLAFFIKKLISQPGFQIHSSQAILERLQKENLSSLWGILILFAIIWIYSVLDAFWTGKKLERQAEGNRV